MYEQTRDQFTKAAAAYSRSPLFGQGTDLSWLVEAGTPGPDETALDIGTAAGFTALALAPHVRQVVGVDITPAMLETARANAQARGLANVRFEQANAEALPYPDASFAIVACRFTAHHFHNPHAAIGEAARVLRPGGRLVVIDNVAPDHPALDAWINTVDKLRDPSHVKQWNGREWQELMTGAGLTFESLHTWLLRLEFDDWTTRQNTPPEQVAALRALFAAAGPAERATFAIGDGGFSLPTRLMRGVKPA